MAKKHKTRYSSVSATVSCSCGWSDKALHREHGRDLIAKHVSSLSLERRDELVRAAHANLLKTHGGLVMRCSDSFECARCGASGAVMSFGPYGAVITGEALNTRCAP